jgi:hypothetical protein
MYVDTDAYIHIYLHTHTQILRALSSELEDGWFIVLTMLKNIAEEGDPEQVCLCMCMCVCMYVHVLYS